MRIKHANIFLADEKIPYLKILETKNYPVVQSIRHNGDVFNICTGYLNMDKLNEEYLYLFALNANNHLLGLFECGHGSKEMAYAGIKEIMLRAILSGASSIILAHNHPSGDCTPSECDLQMTAKIEQACKLLDITFLAHLIIGDSDYADCKR